jgi:hypothetical protein
MKKGLYLIMLILISCTKNIENCSTENGFGKLELGLTRTEFKKRFPKQIVNDLNIGIFHFDKLKVSKNIELENVEVWFSLDQKIIQIDTESNPDLFNLLKKQNGIVANKKIGNDECIEFKTNSKDIACIYLKFRNKKPKIGFVNMKAMRID